jgi:hypothetical protein
MSAATKKKEIFESAALEELDRIVRVLDYDARELLFTEWKKNNLVCVQVNTAVRGLDISQKGERVLIERLMEHARQQLAKEIINSAAVSHIKLPAFNQDVTNFLFRCLLIRDP